MGVYSRTITNREIVLRENRNFIKYFRHSVIIKDLYCEDDFSYGSVRGDTCFGVAKTQGGVNFACYKIHEITPYTFMCREFSKPGPLKSSPPLNLVPGNFACYKTEWAL